MLDRLVSDLPDSTLRAVRQRLVFKPSPTPWSGLKSLIDHETGFAVPRLTQHFAGHPHDVIEWVAIAVQVEH